jgi:hypothetical protein
MGGIGSGRRNQSGKATTSDRRPLDIRRLQRDGLLTPGRSCSWQWRCYGQEVASIQIRAEAGQVILNYQNRSNGGDWQPKEYPICVEWTDCNLGGQRAWFRCPAMGCGKRVAILYAGAIFTCRHCQKLAYACQRETLDDRSARRADTLRRRLQWPAGILNGTGGKPKGMHWRTFERLKAEHNAFVRVSLTEMRLRFGLTNHELDDMGVDLDGIYRGD